MSGKTGKKGPKLPPASPEFKPKSLEELQTFYDNKLQEIQASYDDKLKIAEANFQGKIDTVHRILEQKEDIISKLNREIGELKTGMNFHSSEISEIRKNVGEMKKDSESKFNDTNKKVDDVKTKTVDLEDRSRRCNLVFFNFKEAPNTKEDCEKKVDDLITSLNLLNGEDAWIDRAHRLGKRKPENDSKPRPIIVKFAYYKQKEKIIQSGNKFKNCEINVCEDYSKQTLLVHKQLWKYGKQAKETLYHDNLKAITYYKIAYKRLVLTYTTNKNNTTASTFTRSFSLDYIQRNRSWFVPPNHQSV